MRILIRASCKTSLLVILPSVKCIQLNVYCTQESPLTRGLFNDNYSHIWAIIWECFLQALDGFWLSCMVGIVVSAHAIERILKQSTPTSANRQSCAPPEPICYGMNPSNYPPPTVSTSLTMSVLGGNVMSHEPFS